MNPKVDYCLFFLTRNVFCIVILHVTLRGKSWTFLFIECNIQSADNYQPSQEDNRGLFNICCHLSDESKYSLCLEDFKISNYNLLIKLLSPSAKKTKQNNKKTVILLFIFDIVKQSKSEKLENTSTCVYDDFIISMPLLIAEVSIL